LLECLIVCGLVILALTMGLEALRVCRGIDTRARVVSALSLAAQKDLASTAAEPFDSLTSGTTQTTLDLPSAGAASGSGVPADLERSVAVISPNLKEITVRLSWRGGKDPCSVTMTTRVARKEAGQP